MFMTNRTLHSAALAAALALPIAAAPAFAQTADSGQTSGDSTESTQMAPQAAPEGTTAGDPMAAPSPDQVVATVGGTDILGEDVVAAIALLPPQVQAQPPQMLIPLALEQLILRELILQEAQSQNLAEDPEVTQLVEQTMQDAQSNAMVQIWLERETADAVTDEAVQQYYDEAKAQGGENFPPLEEVRPQIEQHLRQQQMSELRTSLREGADVVLYGPNGEPMEDAQGEGAMGAASGGQGGMNAASEGQSTMDATSGGQGNMDAAPEGQSDMGTAAGGQADTEADADRPTEGPVDTPADETTPEN